MADTNDLTTTIAGAAAGPSSVSIDGNTVVQRPLADLITADQYLKGQAAAKKKNRGVRYARVQMPGGV